MKQAIRDRIVRAVIIVTVLGSATACSTAGVQPSASPGATSGDAENCVRGGGVWRGGVCESMGGGGGGGGY